MKKFILFTLFFSVIALAVIGPYPGGSSSGGGGGGSGTVTSVSATVPSVFSVSGVPITTSGTIAMSYSGTALPIANGGTGATSAAAALSALGGVGGTATSGQMCYWNGTGTITGDAGLTYTAATRNITQTISSTSTASIYDMNLGTSLDTSTTRGMYIHGTAPTNSFYGGQTVLSSPSGKSNPTIGSYIDVSGGITATSYDSGVYITNNTQNDSSELAGYSGNLRGDFGIYASTGSNNNTGGAIGIRTISFNNLIAVGGDFYALLGLLSTSKSYGVRTMATRENGSQAVGIMSRIYSTAGVTGERLAADTNAAGVFDNGDTAFPMVVASHGGSSLWYVGAGGKQSAISTGAAPIVGTASCNGSTEVTVNTTAVGANTLIFYSFQTVGGTPLGVVYTSSRVAGTSFGFKCAATDTSTVAWMLVEKF